MARKPIRSRTFIGRAAELDVLEDARRALASSRGSFILLEGEAGIGKTRVLHEFVERCRTGRARHVVATECLEHVQQPLGPIRALVKALLPKFDIAALRPSTQLALRQILPDRHDTSDQNTPLERQELFDELVSLLQTICTRRATIVTVEDIHWADESTLGFLSYLAHRMTSLRLLIVVTCRSEELGSNGELLGGLASLLRENALVQLELGPLASNELRALVSDVLEGHEPLHGDALADIERRSEGNPFFAEELVGEYLAGGRNAPLPRSVRASIAIRLGRLTAWERSVLQHAAALGQEFDPELLALALECTTAEILPALRRGHDLNLLVDAKRQRQTCRFRHALTRQAVYDELPSFEAQHLHARILSTLEAGGRVHPRLEELAYHAWQSGDRRKTFRYNEAAGEATFSMRALAESLDCFERALTAADSSGERARMLARIGAIQRLQGRYQPAVDAFQQALQLELDSQNYNGAAGSATSVLAQKYNLGDADALPEAREFLAAYGDRIDEDHRNRLIVMCARVAAALYDVPAASGFLSAIPQPASLPPDIRQHELIVRLMMHAYYGRAESWDESATEAEGLSRTLPPHAVVGLQSALALTGVYLAQHQRVERALSRAQRLEAQWNLRGPRVYNEAIASAYYYQRGRLLDAARYVDNVAAHLDVGPAFLVAAPVAARLAVALGDDRIWRPFDAPARMVLADLAEPDAILLAGSHAELLAARKEPTAAGDQLSRAILALPYATPDAMYVLHEAARNGPQEIQARVSRLADVAAETGETVPAATAAMVRALQSRAQSNGSAAAVHGATAAERYRSLGWPLLEAQALELCGDLQGASTIYERCGAVGYLRHVRAGMNPRGESLGQLSPREHEVATLIARGLSNAEIARDLSIGNKTVEKHVSSVFDKLGLRSRSQVTALLISSKAAS